jgi:hypothetical protein
MSTLAADRNTAPTVWLLVASANTQNINPDALAPYGQVCSIFPARHNGAWQPEETLAKLYDALHGYRPGDYICWMGGDTLIAILAGVALERLGVEQVKWLRYIGREEYQVVPIQVADMALPHTRDDA